MTFKKQTKYNWFLFLQKFANLFYLILTDRDQQIQRGGLKLHEVKPRGLAALEELHKHKAAWGKMG